MKKIFATLISIIISGSFFLTSGAVLAAPGDDINAVIDSPIECTTTFCGGGLREGLDKTKPELRGKGISTADSLITVILGLIEFSLPFAGLFAFVGVIYGGFLYVTSFAEDQTEKARNILIWSAIGLIIIFIAYPFVATLIKFQS